MIFAGLQELVVMRHEHAVGGDVDVEFDPVRAFFEGEIEGREGVFAGQARAAAVAENQGTLVRQLPEFFSEQDGPSLPECDSTAELMPDECSQRLRGRSRGRE